MEAFWAASLLLLFLPATPMLFMGQEWASSAPFLYFSDHEGELGTRVSHGRRQEFGHFSAFKNADVEQIPDPQDESTFLRSKLNWSERHSPEHAQTLALYRRGLELRRTDPVLREARELSVGTLGSTLWAVRRTAHGERLLLFNAGPATTLLEVAGRTATEARLLLSSCGPIPVASRFELPAMSATIYALAPPREVRRV